MGRPKGSKNKTKPKLKPPGVSVVIPHVTDPFIRLTVETVFADCPTAQIVIVQDGAQPDLAMPTGVRVLRPWPERRGVGPSRDAGIGNASNDIIVVMDAHVRVLPGAIEGLSDVVRSDPTAVACALSGCSHADLTNTVISDPAYYYTGGRVRYQTEQGWPLEPGWMVGLEPGTELGCALGGMYALSQARYNALGCPWKRMIGWGTGEQTLCMVNWFHGGSTILADAKGDHVYRDSTESLPYETPERIKAGIYYNRLRLLDMMPIPQREREKLILAAEVHARKRRDDARRMLYERRHDECKDAMALAVRTWDDWCARWWPGISRDPIQATFRPGAIIHKPPAPTPGMRSGSGNISHIHCDPRVWLP